MWWFHLRRSCIELKSLIPIEHPFSCSTTKTKNESVVIKCCKSHDMCNEGLRLDLQPKPPGRSDVEVVPSMCPANYCTLASRCWHSTPGIPHAKRPAPLLLRRRQPWCMVQDCMANDFIFSSFCSNITKIFFCWPVFDHHSGFILSFCTNIRIYERRCWDRGYIFPPGDMPIWCRKDENPNISCCATDYCNRDLFAGTVYIRMCRRGALSGKLTLWCPHQMYCWVLPCYSNVHMRLLI